MEKSKIMVSILIPVYNTEKFIERCLISIINQTYKNIEIIVVNDFTPDNSMEIIKKFQQKDARIRIALHDYNKGLMIARQTGINMATGDYILFCDSDDCLPENAVELYLNKANKTKLDIITANSQRISENNVLGCIVKTPVQDMYSKEVVYRLLLSGKLNHDLWGKLFNSSLLKNYNYIFERNIVNGEDAALFYQVIQNSNGVAFLDEILYYYRVNFNSSTQVEFSENAYYSIAFAWRIIHNMVLPIEELSFLLRRREIRAFMTLLRNGSDPEKILSNVKIDTFKENLTIISIIRYSELQYIIIYLYYFFKNYFAIQKFYMKNENKI